MSNKSIIRINSSHVFSKPEEPYRFHVSLGQNSSINAVIGCKIKSVSFNNTEYNIPKGRTAFRYSLDGISMQTIHLLVGQYDITTFMLAVSAQLAIAGITAVFSLNNLTNKIHCDSCSPPINFFDYKFGYDNYIGQKMGISQDHGIVSSVNGFGHVPSLVGLTMCYIRSRTLSNTSSVENVSHAVEDTRTRKNTVIMGSIVEAVGCNVDYGQHFYWENNSLDSIIEYSSPRNISEIDIDITDDEGFSINLQGSELTIILEFFH